MKCNIGDKIRFLNDVGGGIIVGIANKTTVIVRDSDGFDIPTYIANIVVVAENNEKNLITEDRIKPIEFDKTAEITKNKQPTEKSQIKTNSETNIAQPEDSDGIEFEIALGFLPVSADNPNDSDLEIFMINDSSYRMFYTFGKWKQSEIEPVNKGELEGDSKEFVGILKKDEVVESPVFQINLILFKNRNYTAQTVQQIDFEINPVKFLNKKIFTENDFFEQNAYIYILTSSRKKLKDYIDNLSDSDIEK
ncbi:MAG: DUF2027 domain-containing protein [Prevotellaceae bacterium]|jgi:hypothetical protein|nr:DUF2027 domain-containing protein [Prevotellaceae bacterium]